MSSFLVLSEGDTRNRWRDGQVCPDVRQGTTAPWARRLGREKRREKERREERRERERRERREKKNGEKRWKKKGKEKGKEKKRSRGERGARRVWRKGLSPEIGGKKTMNAGGVENRID
ncbi:hypothetical protein TNCV_2411081 [Trichonephila clavipes]|nr:hypothetical protein TNCV_2411081 [Trichonephila clavipes]